MKPAMQVPWLSASQIEGAARRLLTACFGTSTISYPIDTDQIVFEYLYRRDSLCFSDEEDLGVDEAGSDILGKMLARAGKIFVTSRLKGRPNRGRYRYTVGHEIGHWELHRAHIRAALDHPSLFSTDLNEDEPIVAYRHSVFPPRLGAAMERREYQANRFAMALLVSPSELRTEVEARFGCVPVNHLHAPRELRRSTIRGFAKAVASHRTVGESSLDDAFEISTQAMAIALEEYGFVSDTELLL
jgi:hypothetical protein